MKYCTIWKVFTFSPEFDVIDVVKEKCFKNKYEICIGERNAKSIRDI